MIQIEKILCKLKSMIKNILYPIQELFNKNKIYANIFIFVIIPLASLMLSEALINQSIIQAIYWAITSPIIFIINYLLFLSIFSVFLLIFGRANLAASVTIVITTLFALISSQKAALLGEPLLPWDFLMVRQALNLMPKIYNGISIFNSLVIVLAVLSIFITVMLTRNHKSGFIKRLIVGVAGIAVIVGIALNPYTVNIILPKLGIVNYDWMQADNYKKNGMVLAFSMNVKELLIDKPSGYKKETLQEKYVDILKNDTDIEEKAVNTKRPNVIFLMSEAFWDPTQLKGVTFSKDPIPNIHSMMKEYTSGNVLSPAYGGGTANVEFEILTGNSMSFFPNGSSPYLQYINKNMPSLVSVFKNNGYSTTALHTYFKWFFNRSKVYNYLGFEKFLGLEDMIAPNYKGLYVSDEELTNMIINEYKVSKKPSFMYAISMQNHGPYVPVRYSKYDIKVNSKTLSQQSLSILEEYTQGIHDADKAFKRLTDYFKKVKEPTVIVFFGDHLPMLGDNFEVYKQSGFLKSPDGNWSIEEEKDLHTSPFLIWTNYEKKAQNIGMVGSDCFLGSYVLDYINMEKPAYYKFLDNLKAKMPGNVKGLRIHASGEVSNDVTAEEQDLLDTQWLIQYDEMFGKRYITESLWK